MFTKNPLTNIFARLDFIDLPFNSTLMVRYNYGGATQDVFSRGAPGRPVSFPLTSNEYQFLSVKRAAGRATALQLQERLVQRALPRLHDHSRRSRSGGARPADQRDRPRRHPRAGSERSSQANSLAQDYTELTDNYTFTLGNAHRMTVGSQNFLNYRGERVRPEHLRQLDVREPRLARVGPAVFVQRRRRRERHERRGVAVRAAAVRLRAGRVERDEQADGDVRIARGRPELRLEAAAEPGSPHGLRQEHLEHPVRRSRSCRIASGSTGTSTGDQRNQLRGGAGIFTGRPAFVWMSNMFGNTGGLSGFAQLTCNNSAAPKFNATTAATPPTHVHRPA